MGNKRIDSSRRKFVKATAAVAGALAVSSFIEPFKLLLYAAEEPVTEGPWWGIGIDISKCIGCGLCAKSCKTENMVPVEPLL